jgi:hypothetical protein
MKPYFMSNFPSVRPSLNLQFDSQPTPADMTSHLASVGATFSRASIGTYTDANGLIQEATAGQARPNYSTAGVHEGLLIEEARTNLIKSSEQITTDWAQVGVSEFENYAIVSPNGKVNGVKISSNNATFISRHEYTLTLSDNTDYSFTVFLKKASSQYGLLRFTTKDGTNNNVSVNFNASPVAISTDTTSSATLEDYGNDWYKVSMTVDSASGGTSPEIAIWGNTSDNFAIANPIGADVYFFGAQVEAGSFPTSYIPTIPTFSDRDSVATFLGSDGLIQTASVDVARSDTYVYVDDVLTEAGLLLEGSVENLVTSSEDFSTSWTRSNATVTTNQISAPDGTASADEIEATATSSVSYILESITFAVADYTISVYAKESSSSVLWLYVHNGAEQGTAYFDLSDQTTQVVAGSSTTPTNLTIEDVGNGWYRCSATFDNTTVVTSFSGIGVSDAKGSVSVTAGKSMYFWGAQLEEGSQATSYFPTEHSFTSRASSATFFNASGVLSTASTNVARTDHKYIGGEWVEAGLLLEAQATNVLVYSEDFTSRGSIGSGEWSAQNGVTVTTNQAVAPDGTTTADLIDISALNSHHIQYIADHVSADETWTFSCWVKKATSSGDFRIKISGTDVSATSDTVTLTDDWQRLEVTGTFDSSIDGNNWVYVADSRISGVTVTDVYVWGAQFELGSQPTSYIKTTTASATRSADVSSAKSSVDRTRDADSYTTATKTRSADVCYIDGTAFTDFYNQEQGTFFSQSKIIENNEELSFVFEANKADVSERALVVYLSDAISGDIRADITTSSTGSFIDFSVADKFASQKITLSYIDSTANASLNGTLGTPITKDAPDNVEQLYIGRRASSATNYLNGSIKKMIYFPRALSTNELNKLTQ